MLNELLQEAKAGNVDEAYAKVCSLDLSQNLSFQDKENVGWIIFYYLKYSITSIADVEARLALKRYLDLNTSKPSMLHSQILNQALRLADISENFKVLNFIKLWNPNNLDNSCFKKNKFQGKSYPSLYEKIVVHCFNQKNSLKEIFDVLNQEHQELAIESISRAVYFKLWKLSQNNEQDKIIPEIDAYLDYMLGWRVMNEYHSKILNTLIWNLDKNNHWKFATWFEKWGMNDFQDSDWHRNTAKDHEYKSLAETAICHYLDACKASAHQMSEEIESLLVKANVKYPSEELYIRALAHLKFVKGEKKEAMTAMKRLILTTNKYYLWSELAKMTDDVQLQKACLCKALLLQKDDDFTGKIRFRLAKLFIVSGELSEAAFEIDKYEQTYSAKGWNIGVELDNLKKSLKGVKIPENNLSIYSQYEPIADNYIYSEIAATPMVLIEKYEKIINDRRKTKIKLVNKQGEIVDCNPARFGIKKNVPLLTVFDVKLYAIEGKMQVVYMTRSEVKASQVINYKVAVVDNVNLEKQLFHYVIDSKVNGIVNCKNANIKIKTGDLIKVATVTSTYNGKTMTKAVDFIKYEGECPELKKKVYGSIKIKTNQNGKLYGFVENYYVHEKFLHDIHDGDNVVCTVIFDGEKWRVIQI